MLKNVISNFLNLSDRNKFSKLEKEISSNASLFNEYKLLSNPNLSIKNNLYNIHYNVSENICPVCLKSPTKWVEKDFCYRKTCSYSCSGKLLKLNKREYKFPIINTKEEFIELLNNNKIKMTSISKTEFYNDVIKISGDTLQEKVYRWVNDILGDIICGNENCTNSTKFINWSTGFRQYCSVKCSSSSDSKISRIRETCFEKYKVDNVSKRHLHIDKYKKILGDFDMISYDGISFTLIHHKCGHQIDITRRMVYDRNNMNTEICTYCNKVQSVKSGYESQLKQWLVDIGINIDSGNRKIIYPKELDLFLPDHNIAIEFNGLYWHSEDYVGKYYHINKTKLCEEKKIQLIHIWEDDWIYKQDIVKSIIKNKLKINSDKIFSRKCEIREIEDSTLVRDFLNKNHIQGYCKSQYKIGLFYNNELVSLMTFGWRKTNSKKEFELIRFCNKINLTVIGSASRLFSFFIKKYNPNFILSYADVSMFNGDLYGSIGFKFIHRTAPNYFWVVDGIRHHRWKFNKQKLIKEGFNRNKTEDQIMRENGHFKVYSCGQDRYEYTK